MSTPAESVDDAVAKPKPKLGTLRALWPFVRQHAGLFTAWLLALALAGRRRPGRPQVPRRQAQEASTGGLLVRQPPRTPLSMRA